MSEKVDITNIVWAKIIWFNTIRFFAVISWLIFVNLLFHFGIGKDIGIQVLLLPGGKRVAPGRFYHRSAIMPRPPLS